MSLGRKRVTLADVARLAGLSQTAASMILTGRPDTRLSAEAHARVHAAAAELGYRPNLAARALRTDKTRTIAFISDVVATTRFANGLIRGTLEAADRAGHVVLLLETGGEPAREVQAIEAALDRQVDGFIFAAMRAREVFVPSLPAASRVVMLNATSRKHPVSVLPDEFEAGRAAIRLLDSAGIREGLALIGHNKVVEEGYFRSETVSRRLAGIRAEMDQRGMSFLAEESCWNWEAAHGYELVKGLLDRGVPVEALLCLNDRLAFGAYQALGEAGLRIPGDMPVVSFDNDELAADLRPGLTTFALPHEQMGQEAVRLLLAPEIEPFEHLIAMTAVLRQSLANIGGAD
ncbi:MAG TPA: LacI family DNA-binding transcriptional regulator [Kaistia sp.]|nr:LacI family DNA-binding transcriptional regulator [Kaistia sp.]